MKYVFDIDGTICSQESNDYKNATPYMDRIAKINKLYDEGNEIVYYTARGMGRYNDNTDFVKLWFYKVTELQLDKWGCKYHKLILGKPSGHYYIDDKGINSDDFFRD